MIPTTLKLDPRQIKAVVEWRKTLPPMDDYEDVCCSSDVTFEIYATGIGDVIKARCGKSTIDISIDDGNELIGEVTTT